MLNRDAAGAAKAKLAEAAKRYEASQRDCETVTLELYSLRQESSQEVIGSVESLVNSIADHPKEFDRSIAEFEIAYQKFEGVEKAAAQQMSDATIQSSATAGVGVAAGAATAFLGPTAAMAVATTFGTASTGTAIATLSGAAANSAALAWIGGGALAAGGGGMSAGSTVLALSGPIGWTIAGVAAIGGAGYYAYTNNKVATEAAEKTEAIERQRTALDLVVAQVRKLHNLTKQHADGMRAQLKTLKGELPPSYQSFNAHHLRALGSLLNHVQSLSALLNQTLESDASRREEASERASHLTAAVEAFNDSHRKAVDLSLRIHALRLDSYEDLLGELQRLARGFPYCPTEVDAAIAALRKAHEHFLRVSSIAEHQLADVATRMSPGSPALPAAGMVQAIATSFGTVSTGEALEALAGTEKSSDAHAWLLKAAPTMSGRSMRAGTALIGLAGPLEVDTHLVGTAANSRYVACASYANGKAAYYLLESPLEIERQRGAIERAVEELEGLFRDTEQQVIGLRKFLAPLKRHLSSGHDSLSLLPAASVRSIFHSIARRLPELSVQFNRTLEDMNVPADAQGKVLAVDEAAAASWAE